MATIRGGAKFEQALRDIADALGADSPVLRVGFLEGSTYPDGTPVAMVASIQEFGAPRANIPPRPFMRNAIAEHQAEWAPAIANLMRQNDYDGRRVLDITGQAIAGQIRQSIIDTNEPPLAPATIKRKGFSKPLISTSVMINSIDHEVVE